MNNAHTLLKRFHKSEKGSFLILGAVSIILILTLVGGAIDIARYVNVNSKFKDAADTALLAAATTSRSRDVDEVAMEFFAANFPAQYMDSLILKNIDVEANTEKMEWTATVNGQIKTVFGGFLGFDTIAVSHKVTVAWDISKRLEAVFLLDTSASMCTDMERSRREDGAYVIRYRPDYRCKKLNAMKEAMEYVLDYGLSAIDGMGGPAFYAGIIPFNHKVRLPYPENAPTELTFSEQNLTKGDPNYFTNFEDAEPLSQVIPLKSLKSESDKQELKRLVSQITQSPTGNGWTRSNIAALTAALMLDPAKYAAFGGEKPSEFNPGLVDKVVVMMTDGANMGCCYAVHPEDNYDKQYLYLYQADNAHLTGMSAYPNLQKWATDYNISSQGLCSQMKEAGITIYSVVYDVDDNDPGGRKIKDAYRSCASSEQFFFDVRNEEDLKLAYKTIAQSFLRLRITY